MSISNLGIDIYILRVIISISSREENCMRLLHPETLRIVSLVCIDEDFDKATVSRKTVISNSWTETLKFLRTRQKHPKMFLGTDFNYGVYLRISKTYGNIVGCDLKEIHLEKYSNVLNGYNTHNNLKKACEYFSLDTYFDNNYLFSDCVSLYLKGLNIFPYVYGNDARRLIPIESLDEIVRVTTKAINRRKP